jgi:ubiquinone/menaquinone biosynthesis C-methylase UbiE
MFDNIAKEWDSEKRIERAKLIANEMLENVDIDSKSTGLEFGCGTGLISFNLIDKLDKITLIDTSKGMIDVLKEKIEKADVENMIPLQGDVDYLIKKGEKYDFIYTSMVLHHIDDAKGTIGKLIQLLNKNGLLCVVDLNTESGSFHGDEGDFHGHNGFDQREIQSIFTRYGLEEVASHTFYKGIKETKEKNVDYSLFIARGRK